ncbi:hypothetical protein A45J_2067 [hot springs metagenome]|uniref:Uncharacterized protein n=1 Tax=hot springs metagenome TaxID=433727 RepID=A0A5J4L9S8_9ZZZZ
MDFISLSLYLSLQLCFHFIFHSSLAGLKGLRVKGRLKALG